MVGGKDIGVNVSHSSGLLTGDEELVHDEKIDRSFT